MLLNIPVTLYLFYFLAFVAIFCGILVVASKNPVHSVLYLVLTFFCIAGHYILLNAQFLAVVHIVVYAGAIMVLFLFIIMLMNLNADTEPRKHVFARLTAGLAGGMLLFVMVGSLRGAEQLNLTQAGASQIGLVKNLGKVLFSEFLFPFEIASV